MGIVLKVHAFVTQDSKDQTALLESVWLTVENMENVKMVSVNV